MDDSVNKPTGEMGCLLRMLWMAGLPVSTFIVLVTIVKHHSPFPSLLDGLYLLLISALVAIRYVDVRLCAGTAADGTPATMKHWRRFSLIVVTLTLGTWISARLAM